MANGHGGARPNSGGPRPNAGRPRKTTQDLRQRFQEMVVKKWTTDQDMQTVWDVTKARAKAGDAQARADFFKWTLGNPPQSLEVTGDEGGPLLVRVLYADHRPSAPEAAPESGQSH